MESINAMKHGNDLYYETKTTLNKLWDILRSVCSFPGIGPSTGFGRTSSLRAWVSQTKVRSTMFRDPGHRIICHLSLLHKTIKSLWSEHLARLLYASTILMFYFASHSLNYIVLLHTFAQEMGNKTSCKLQWWWPIFDCVPAGSINCAMKKAVL